jgi:hypothetical protein
VEIKSGEGMRLAPINSSMKTDQAFTVDFTCTS